MKIAILICVSITTLIVVGIVLYIAMYSGAPEGAYVVAPGAWWSDATAGLIGGIVGAVVVVLAGLVGVLASTGKSRRLVVGVVRGLTVFGVVCLAFGLVALLKGQPRAIYQGGLIYGVILTLGIGLQVRTFEARYREIELTKMRVHDVTDEGRGT